MQQRPAEAVTTGRSAFRKVCASAQQPGRGLLTLDMGADTLALLQTGGEKCHRGLRCQLLIFSNLFALCSQGLS